MKEWKSGGENEKQILRKFVGNNLWTICFLFIFALTFIRPEEWENERVKKGKNEKVKNERMIDGTGK